mmetsp:Transcript_7727/g.18896  ORF Transcript_7727/g.18896 Transcript_7727/m.18896 type:complete len:278 (-) Transcript_7727:1878-2711(-)
MHTLFHTKAQILTVPKGVNMTVTKKSKAIVKIIVKWIGRQNHHPGLQRLLRHHPHPLSLCHNHPDFYPSKTIEIGSSATSWNRTRLSLLRYCHRRHHPPTPPHYHHINNIPCYHHPNNTFVSLQNSLLFMITAISIIMTILRHHSNDSCLRTIIIKNIKMIVMSINMIIISVKIQNIANTMKNFQQHKETYQTQEHWKLPSPAMKTRIPCIASVMSTMLVIVLGRRKFYQMILRTILKKLLPPNSTRRSDMREMKQKICECCSFGSFKDSTTPTTSQ